MTELEVVKKFDNVRFDSLYKCARRTERDRGEITDSWPDKACWCGAF